MVKDDKNNSSAPEEDKIDYKHTASEIEALRAILKRKKDEDDEDENGNNSEEPERE